MVSDIVFSFSIVSTCPSSLLPAVTGNNLFFPNNSSMSILTFLGSTNNPRDATNISFNNIVGSTFPFNAYAITALPAKNPTITPIFPSLFSIPASIPRQCVSC